MKKVLLFFIFATVSSIAQAQIVNIPDANFKNALLHNQPVIDTNNDGEIQLSEALTITHLSIFCSLIYDMTGLGSFTNLTTLNISDSPIASLDVSNLASLQTSTCEYTLNLSSLNMSGLSNLVNLNLKNTSIVNLNISAQGPEDRKNN